MNSAKKSRRQFKLRLESDAFDHENKGLFILCDCDLSFFSATNRLCGVQCKYSHGATVTQPNTCNE